MLEKKRLEFEEGLVVQLRLLQCGYADTSSGLTLTKAAAMELVRGKDALIRAKLAAKPDKEADIA